MTGAPFRPVDCRPKTETWRDCAMTRPAPRHEEDNLAVQFAEWAAELTVTAVPNHHHWQEDDIAYNIS